MNIGIVGCGLIGAKRARAARGHPVVSVYDPDAPKAAALAAETGARAARSIEELLASPRLDAVVIATPHDRLAKTALAALRRGKHVLLEKPGARNASELRPLAAAAKRTKRIVKVGFNHRFHPAFLKAREIVDARDLGPLLYIRARYGHGGRKGYEKEWRANKTIAGGGELIDQGIHLIDLSRWFLGEFTRVDGRLATYFWNMRVEDNAFLSLQTRTGRTAWLHASWTEWKNIFCFEIFGRDGKLQVDGLGGSYGAERLTHYRMKPEMGPPGIQTWEFSGDDSWNEEFAEFARAVAENRQPSGNLSDAAAALKIIDTLYRKNG